MMIWASVYSTKRFEVLYVTFAVPVRVVAESSGFVTWSVY